MLRQLHGELFISILRFAMNIHVLYVEGIWEVWAHNARRGFFMPQPVAKECLAQISRVSLTRLH